MLGTPITSQDATCPLVAYWSIEVKLHCVTELVVLFALSSYLRTNS